MLVGQNCVQKLFANCSKRYREATSARILPLEFGTSYQINLKKTRFGGGKRTITFLKNGDGSDTTYLRSKDKTLMVYIGPGLPNCTSIFLMHRV